MKRTFSLILAALLALSLCGCADLPVDGTTVTELATIPAETTAATKPAADLEAASAAMEAWSALVCGEASFTDTKTGRVLSIQDGAIDGSTVEQFTLMDMDSDGTNELVLSIGANNADNLGFWILDHSADGIRGYVLTYRELGALKEDATFVCSTENGYSIGTICFTADGWQMDATAQSENGRYTIDGQESTFEQVEAALTRQVDKPNARMYFFSPETYAWAVSQGHQVTISDILAGNGVFYSGEAQIYITLSEYCTRLGADIVKITAVDLDGDSEKEAVLQLANSDYGALILRQMDGWVKGDAELKQLLHVKTDGTIHWSGGTISQDVVDRMEFNGNYWASNNLLRQENGTAGTVYYINLTETTQEAFETALAKERAKEEVHWMDYPSDNYGELFQ